MKPDREFSARFFAFSYDCHFTKNRYFFYYILGDRLWGEYGFKDAFNLDRRWIASSYIAIDQGPIVIMMENYRTGLLWDLFMKNSDILTGLSRLGFTVSGQSAVLR